MLWFSTYVYIHLYIADTRLAIVQVERTMHMLYMYMYVHVLFTTLYSVEHTSGVVVDVGHGVATCCVVWEGEEWEGGECPGSLSCDPLECTAPAVAKMVHSLLQTSCTAEMRAVLQERVVLTG